MSMSGLIIPVFWTWEVGNWQCTPLKFTWKEGYPFIVMCGSLETGLIVQVDIVEILEVLSGELNNGVVMKKTIQFMGTERPLCSRVECSSSHSALFSYSWK